MTDPITVTGGSIAALACADTFAAAGLSVRLLLPRKGAGGGFAPMRREGRGLELGVRLFELAYEGVEEDDIPPLADYEPAIGHHRAYTPLVRRWVQERAGDRLVQADRPRMVLDGHVVDDLLFTTDATVLRHALGDEERAAIRAEAEVAAAAQGDAGPLADDRADELAGMSLQDASLACHGPTFHGRFAEPYAGKIVGGTHDVLATLRRKAWVPLFWPRTLAEACGDGPVSFHPDRPFHGLTGGGAGQIVDLLLDRLRAHPRVEVREVGALEHVAPANGSGVRMDFADTGTIFARRPVIANAPSELFAAAGIDYTPEKARTVIVWLDVAASDLLWIPGLLNVVDRADPIVRVSSGGWSATADHRILTVELAHDTDPKAAVPAVIASLKRYGILAEGASPEVAMAVAAPTFALPTADNVARFDRAHDQFIGLGLDADLAGGVTDFGADAFNEQVVQALHLTELRT